MLKLFVNLSVGFKGLRCRIVESRMFTRELIVIVRIFIYEKFPPRIYLFSNFLIFTFFDMRFEIFLPKLSHTALKTATTKISFPRAGNENKNY